MSRRFILRRLIGAALVAASLAVAAPAHASPVVVRPVPASTTVTVPPTVILARAPVTIWYEVFGNRFLLLCKETASDNPHLGSALTCGNYDLTVPSEVSRFTGDLWAWVLAALR
jgi:hypothetical protein